MFRILILLLTMQGMQVHANSETFGKWLDKTPVEDVPQKIALNLHIKQMPNGPVATISNLNAETSKLLGIIAAKNTCVHNLLAFIQDQKELDQPLIKEIESLIRNGDEKSLKFNLSMSVPEGSQNIELSQALIVLGAKVDNGYAGYSIGKIQASSSCKTDEFYNAILDEVRKNGDTYFKFDKLNPRQNLHRALTTGQSK